MTDKSARDHVERVIALTDRLLAGEKPDNQMISGADQEQNQILHILQVLTRDLSVRKPDTAFRNRVRAKIAARWNIEGPGSIQKNSKWQNRQQLRWIVGFGMAVFLILLLAAGLFFSGNINVELPGSAQHPSIFVAVAAGFVVIMIMLWFRSKSK